MERMSHFVEERHDISMAHQRGPSWSGLGEVGHHCDERVVQRAVGLVVRREKPPNGCMGVFGS